MSATISTSKPADLKGLSVFGTLRIWWTLLKKEIREIGFIGGFIAIVGLLLIEIGFGSYSSSDWLQQLFPHQSSFANFAKVTPLLVVLVCGAATFAIEHENRSYQFLRTLPVSAGTIFWVKLFCLLLITSASCAVFWNYAYYRIISAFSGDNGEFSTSLNATLVSMGEAAMWALFFSLKEKKVIVAIVRASLWFFVINTGLYYYSNADLYNRTWDAWIYWITMSLRLGVVLALVLLIRWKAVGWFRESSVIRSRSKAPDQAIAADQPRALASIQRLVWIQLRANWRLLTAAGLASIGILLATNFLSGPWGRNFAYGQGQLYWCLSISILGVVAGMSPSRDKRMLVANGFSPLKIWLVSSTTVLLFCTFVGFLFWLMAQPLLPPDQSNSWFYFQTVLIGFAAGQFSTLFCRSFISACFGGILLAFVSYFLFMVSLSLFRNQVPTMIALAILPLSVVALQQKRLVNTAKLGMTFWFLTPVAFATALFPLALLRIYDVPAFDRDLLKTRLLHSVPYSSDDLYLIRQHADELLEIEQRVTRSGVSFRNYIRRFPELENQYRHHLSAILSTDASWQILLSSGYNNLRDIKRFEAIKNGFKDLLSQPLSDEKNFDVLNLAITQHLKWSYGKLDPGNFYWWSNHPKTRSEDIRNLIGQLENEEDVFEFQKAIANANYRIADAVTSLDFSEFSTHNPGRLEALAWTPWEISRLKRVIGKQHEKHYGLIVKLQEYHRDHEFGYKEFSLRTYPNPANLVREWRGHFTPFQPAQIESDLFYRRSYALYLALALWQKEKGALPETLDELVVHGYLKKVPVGPPAGETFYLAPKGLTLDQILESPNIEFLTVEWQNTLQSAGKSYISVQNRPFFWTNSPFKFDRFRKTGPPGTAIIRSVDELIKKKGNSTLSFWMLPKNGD